VRPHRVPALASGQVDQKLLIAVLGVVIVGCVGFALYTMLRPPEERADERHARNVLEFKCDKCGGTFSLTIRDLANQSLDRSEMRPVGNGMPKSDCPLCKGKYCATVVTMPQADPEKMVPLGPSGGGGMGAGTGGGTGAGTGGGTGGGTPRRN
jgi:hypothetical protein